MLENFAPGYGELTEKERGALHQFMVLWTIFEAQVLNNSASVKAISNKVEQWEALLKEFSDELNTCFDYFKVRYTEQGSLNHRFPHLHLRQGDMPEFVSEVLLAEEVSLKDKMLAVMIIIYRYRNNFFHGMKWAYQMRDQQKNFDVSSNILMRCIEIDKYY